MTTPEAIRAWLETRLPHLTEWDQPHQFFLLLAQPDTPELTPFLLAPPEPVADSHPTEFLSHLHHALTAPSPAARVMRKHLRVPDRLCALGVITEAWKKDLRDEDGTPLPEAGEPREVRLLAMVEPNGTPHLYAQYRTSHSGPEPLDPDMSPALNPDASEFPFAELLPQMKALASALGTHNLAHA